MHVYRFVLTTLIRSIYLLREYLDADRMNKSIEVILRMQAVLLNKSIGVPVFESTTERKNRGQTMRDCSVIRVLTASVFHFTDGYSSYE